MDFKEWFYLWPPRPEKAIAKGFLNYYENEGWWAQAKLNGTCNVMGIAPDRRTIKAMSRHNDDHKAWSPSPHTAAPFKNLPGDGWYVFTAELLHSKGTGHKDINYIHDILVADGVHLNDTTFAERQAMLAALFPNAKEVGSNAHLVIDEHTWLAKNIKGDLSEFFDGLKGKEHEGVVLKNPRAKLHRCTRQSANAGWQVKCRRADLSPNFGF